MYTKLFSNKKYTKLMRPWSSVNVNAPNFFVLRRDVYFQRIICGVLLSPLNGSWISRMSAVVYMSKMCYNSNINHGYLKKKRIIGSIKYNGGFICNA